MYAITMKVATSIHVHDHPLCWLFVVVVVVFVFAVGEVLKNTYLVKISIASSSYSCLCPSGSSVSDSSLMKA